MSFKTSYEGEKRKTVTETERVNGREFPVCAAENDQMGGRNGK